MLISSASFFSFIPHYGLYSVIGVLRVKLARRLRYSLFSILSLTYTSPYTLFLY